MNASGKPNRVGAIARRLLARAGVLGIASLALVLCGAVALVWAADPFSGTKQLAAKALSLKAAPKSATVAAGGTATFTLKVKPVTGRPKVSATGLPSGAAATFKTKLGKTKTAPAKVTMSVKTATSTPGGTYSLKLRGKSGASKGSAAVTLTVQGGAAAPTASAAPPATSPPPPPPPPAPTTEPPPSDRVFGATAVLPAPLVPGVPQKLDLLVQNLTTVDIAIQGLSVGFDRVEAPQCGVADFAFTQIAGAITGAIPAGGSKKLSELGVAQANLPTVQLANRNVNQDGCQNAFATLAVQGTATGAKWTGNGSGTLNSVVGFPQPLSLATAPPRGQVAPGGNIDVDVTVTNPNAFVMHVSTVVLDTAAGTNGFDVDAAHAGCALSALHFAPQTNGGAGWDVAPRVGGVDGSRTIELAGALSMDDNAANACQGATFTVHLKGGN